MPNLFSWIAKAGTHPARDMFLGRYAVGPVIGEGEFGIVRSAHDSVLPREVAVKTLKRKYQRSRTALKRFANEARAAAALGHHNIVTIFDLHPTEVPIHIVMEYFPKGSVAGLLVHTGVLAVEQVVSVGVDLCHALEAAHAKGIIHRDIKPENILLTETVLYILSDFVIAHVPASLGGYHRSVHPEGHPRTLPYGSPEQVKGEELDGRSDLYSLGAVLYLLATGRFYFDLSSCKSPFDVDNAVLNYCPTAPSQWNPHVPPPLDEAILRLLAKSRENRYSGALEVADVLQSCVRGRIHKTTMQVQLLAIHGSVRREGNRFRFQIRLEAESQATEIFRWGGLTINLSSITSRDLIAPGSLNAWSTGSAPPFWKAPGETIFGFKDDSSFGEKSAACLLIETLMSPWNPGDRITLEAVLTLPLERLQAHVRAWATWPKPDGSSVTVGDPDWSAVGLRDQQGIPAYSMDIGFR